MTKTIWKQEIPFLALEDDGSIEIELPAPFHVLSVQGHYNKLMLWAIVRPDSKPITRRFFVFRTGQPVPSDFPASAHVGTVLMGNGALVLHIFNA